MNHAVSIVIPTFCEAKNIPELLKRIANIPWGTRLFEVILVDDNSCDGISEIVEDLSRDYPWLRLIIRYGKKSLSQAVIDGLNAAKNPLLIIMDADLSHPPEKIPEMLNTLADSNIDFVIGSRYIEGGSKDVSWPIVRKLSSLSAAFFAKLLLRVHVKDPLSGFIALHQKTYLAGKHFKPIGWKIGLELIVKCQCKKIKEIPIHFAKRTQGESKLNFKVILNYINHMLQLLVFKAFYRKESESK